MEIKYSIPTDSMPTDIYIYIYIYIYIVNKYVNDVGNQVVTG